jgi:flagellin-like hook-associated protein FlgL
MSTVKKDEPVTIDPVTTAPGVLGERGMVPVGTRLTGLPVEQFSEKWMKAVTKQDQGKVKSYQTRLAAEKKEAQGPGVEEALNAVDETREQIKSVNGKLGAMQQKMDAMQAEIDALEKAKEEPKAAAPKPEAKDAGAKNEE